MIMRKFDIQEIKEIARQAGEEVMKYYNTDSKIKDKGPGSPLTKADLAANEIILKGLEKYKIPILSEESRDNPERLKADYVWIVDPVDGTSDFIEKTGEFAIMMGLVYKNKPILGVIYLPVLGDFYFAEKNKGAFRETKGEVRRMAVNQKENFKEMTILVSRNHLQETEVKLKDALKVGKMKKMGSVLKILKIAEGEAELNINSSDKTYQWDTCAGDIILTEAGGEITDMQGREIIYNQKETRNLNGYVASNGEKHEEVIEKLGLIDHEFTNPLQKFKVISHQ